MKIVNLTGKQVYVRTKFEYLSFPKEKNMVKLYLKEYSDTVLDYIEFHTLEPKIIGLPKPTQNTIYLVPEKILPYTKTRNDVYAISKTRKLISFYKLGD